MFSIEELALQTAERQRADRAAEDAKIAELAEPEKGYFFQALRSGATSVGMALNCAKQRVRREAAEAAKLAARKPAPKRPNVLETARKAADDARRRAEFKAELATKYDLRTFPKPATAKSYPATALQLRAGSPFELLASAGGSTAGPVTANVLARSGKGIQHPWWGLLVHDMAGREQVKDRLPLDYCHDSGEILGYAEDWRTGPDGLTCVATLMPGESERAREVISLARKGVPYEASISFAPIEIEELKAGRSATINGQLVSGPASVIRRWRLTGLAVCPRGADPNTETKIVR